MDTSQPTTSVEIVRVDELSEGDIVRTHGLRVQLGAVREYDHDSEYGPTRSFAGTILNPEYLRTDEGRYLFGGIIPLDGSSGWTVQGNNLTDWVRETSSEVRGEER